MQSERITLREAQSRLNERLYASSAILIRLLILPLLL